MNAKQDHAGGGEHMEQLLRQLTESGLEPEALLRLAKLRDALIVDGGTNTLLVQEGGRLRELPFDDRESFYRLSRPWLQVGWHTQYYGTFSWLGVPLFQIPEDLMRVQDAFWRAKPDVVIETGIYMGGSLAFLASLCRMAGRGRVIGVDVDIHPDLEKNIAPFARDITVHHGSSTGNDVLEAIKSSINPGERVMVILDADHSKAHVAAELECYGPLVSKDSFLLVCDGIMRDLPIGNAAAPEAWRDDNPMEAIREYAPRHPEFAWEEPEWSVAFGPHVGFAKDFHAAAARVSGALPYVESNITYHRCGWLKKIA